MRRVFYILLFTYTSVFSQQDIKVTFIDSILLRTETIHGIDTFGRVYHSNNNTFHKKSVDTAITYSNVQLGKLASANVFNPLKINLFYQDFNSVVILDNRLAEIFKIDFNTTKLYKNVSHVSTGYDNTIWAFNQDTQQLDLFDYKAQITKIQTLPVTSEVLDLKSNYNYCWLLTEEYLYKFNYFGLNTLKIKNEGFVELVNINENLILKKDNKLYYLGHNESKPKEIQVPKLLINAFFVNNETLYIYHNEYLYKYQLKIN